MTSYRSIKRGFTLVEILIVVIILGILAAIVIPQFTNASTEARSNSTRSQLQTLRSQVELYKLQHGDAYPTSNGTLVGGTWTWASLTGTTTFGGQNYGPYLQSAPINSLRTSSAAASGVIVCTAEQVAGAAVAGGTVAADTGFVVTPTGKVWSLTGGASPTVFQD